MSAHFSFTKLVVHDLEAMSAYYQRIYGLKEFDRVQAKIEGEAIDEIMLGVDSAYGPGSIILLRFVDRPAPRPGAVILGFQTDDLDALVERTLEHGGSLHSGISESEVAPVRVAFTVDPEGNLAECVQMVAPVSPS
jgi:predicted enzyme related to lactoylglutathione lyase